MGLSLTALRRRFKEATGMPLHTWVLQHRVAQARTLLSESDLPLKAIALQLGYNNVYFFARQFKQMTGVAPGHYRKSRL
jgi:AraC-like DNA-binding protein